MVLDVWCVSSRLPAILHKRTTTDRCSAFRRAPRSCCSPSRPSGREIARRTPRAARRARRRLAATENTIVVDCRDHHLGRLASIIAKELLNGQKVVCVRTEGIVITGSLVKNRLKYLQFLRKRHCTNPTKGPYHYRAPGRFLWRVIRGMLPHKTDRGAAALNRLKVFEGVPPPYDKMKRMVVPGAIRALRLRSDRSYTVLGRLCTLVGWKYQEIVDKLEDKRKVRSAAYYQRKKALNQLAAKAKAQAHASLDKDEQAILANVE